VAPVAAKIMKKEIAAAARGIFLIAVNMKSTSVECGQPPELTAETANNNPQWSLKLYVFSPARVSARPANVANAVYLRTTPPGLSRNHLMCSPGTPDAA
jgi:hypothetical protein